MLLPHRPRDRRAGRPARTLAAAASAALVLSACGAATDDDPATTADDGGDVEPLQVVATTSILGDIASELLGDQGEVQVLMGPGVDPHGYQPSARDGAQLREADLVVANGLQLEENLLDTLEAAEEDGVEVFELASGLDPIDFDFEIDGDHGHSHGDDGDDHGHEDEGDDHGHSHDDEGDEHGHEDEGDDHGHAHDDEGGDHGHEDEGDDHGHEDEGDDHGHEDEGDEHGHEDEGDDHGHSHGPEDPHVWFDPIRMIDGVEQLAAALIDAGDDLDADAIEERVESYTSELESIHEELEAAFAEVDDEDRVVVTNHDALGYLADRYDFEVVGTVIPGASTQAETDAAQFADLIQTVEEFGITTVFAENTDSTVLAEQLASEVVDRSDIEVEVVHIATDALDEPGSEADSYLGLLRSTGLRVAESLQG